jgi:CelD/BcsL family acetyltransferase involved in cellulose biosynthesis
MVNEKKSQQKECLTLQIVKDKAEISDLSADWDDLFVRATDAAPYLSRPWISTFIYEDRIRGDLLFILVWSKTKLVALLPLAVRKSKGSTIAEPVGTGQPSYLGLLLDSDYPKAAEYIAEAVKEQKLFDLFYIEDISSKDNATNAFLTELAKKGFSVHRSYRDPCPFIQLGCSYEEYMNKTKSGKSRQTIRRKERQLHKKHEFDIVSYSNSEMTEDVIGRVASIQEQSWMKRRGAAVLGLPFYRKLMLAMSQAGLAKTWLMTIEGNDAAFVLALVAHKKLLYAWTAFKLEYASSLSVGQVLTNSVIRDACDDGMISFDFLHGDADYKRFWGTDQSDVHRAVAGRGLMGRLLAIFYYTLWRIAEIKWLHSFYRRVKRMLHIY